VHTASTRLLVLGAALLAAVALLSIFTTTAMSAISAGWPSYARPVLVSLQLLQQVARDVLPALGGAALAAGLVLRYQGRRG
jgi:hypothetical protein